ncbi:unnamed protein product [Haemonchus placei]|uniref:Nuclear pore complex protein Nup98-Nup96 n=1 Tax=Haemonchus placei TaxID=6290 RepID=A0A0N4VTZ4_HAEPC|nr:unnamed protein product [Haemonchus placei]
MCLYSSGSLFGQNKPTTNLFGQQNTGTQGSLFGQKSTTSLFGQSTPAAGTSIFVHVTSMNCGFCILTWHNITELEITLSYLAASTVNGTTIKFEPLVSSDTMMKNGSQTTIQTKHMCITAMKAYEGKSIEELRIDDYIANRKTPSTSGGLFGSSTATNAGTSIFGSTPAKPSLFGSSTSTTSPFGATQGSTNTGGLFGSNTATTNTGSLFGKPAGTSAFSFGTPSNTTFGQTTTGSLFGNTQKPGGLFGSSTNTTGQLTNKTVVLGLGLFSSLACSVPTLGSKFVVFSRTCQSSMLLPGSVFGSQPAQQSTGLFGSTQPAQTSLFGANTANQQANTSKHGILLGIMDLCYFTILFVAFGAAAPTTINVPAAAPIVLGSDVNQAQVRFMLQSLISLRPVCEIQMALLDAQIAACPYGDSPLLKMGTVKDTDETPNPISTQRQLKFLAAKSAKSSPLNASMMNGSTGSASLNGSLISSKSSFLPIVPPKKQLTYVLCLLTHLSSLTVFKNSIG